MSERWNAVAIGPDGCLRLICDEEGVPGRVTEAQLLRLGEQFAVSTAAGLVELSLSHWPSELPASLAYWREWVRVFFRAVCYADVLPGAGWSELPCPEEGELQVLAGSAPPMTGLEYLTAGLLRRLWGELCEYVAECGECDPEGAQAWLRRLNPLAHQVGRVTFHLAENKRDAERPFAFLATYSHRVSAQAKPAHRPLAEALKQSVAEGDGGQLERLLEPVRRAAADSAVVAELLKSKRLFAPQALTAAEAYRFLRESAVMESAGVVIRLPNWWAARRRSRPQVQVKIGTSAPAQVGLDSLLDFRPEVVVDGEVLTEAELKQLLKGAPGLQLLRGRWVEVDQERIREAVNHWKKVRASHPNGLEIVQGMRLLAGAAISGSETTAGEESGWTRFEAGGWLRETLQRMRTPEAVDGVGGCQPGRDLQATLRPYQVRGVQWLWFMTELGLGACLADDMGLGKTIQILDLLLQRKRLAGERRCAPSLLIVPASLLGNWKQEAARFAPGLSVCLVHGSEMSAEELRRRTLDPEAGFADCDLVVISYGMVRRQAWLKQVRWSLIILDEAQAIKNSETAQTKAVKGLKSERRLVMTGTPIENHVGELWSLFDFCSPGLLGSVAEFRRYLKRLSEQGDGQAYAGLRRLVQPYILRRQKTDPEISRDLPEKIEMRAECGLTAQQAALYAGVVSDLKRQLKQVDGIQRRGLVLSSLLQFKQICNHPAQFLEEGEYLPEHSAKFERLRQLCEPIRARQEKVLVFTQFQSLCEPLSEFLRGVFGQPGLVLHGGTAVKRRSELVKEFQGDINRPFFVISLKAGGSGLNLTAASHVVHFDRWWNPAVENQATDRAFRIGQQRNVLVHKFVCRGTVEERIDEMIAGKRELAAQILDGDSGVKLTEMKDDELLKFVSLDLERATVV